MLPKVLVLLLAFSARFTASSSSKLLPHKQIAFSHCLAKKTRHPLLVRSHQSCCSVIAIDSKVIPAHHLNIKRRFGTAMQASKSSASPNLGTRSCESSAPSDVVAHSISAWLALHDPEGSQAGKLRVLSVDMDGTIADTRERQRYATAKAGVGPKAMKGVDNTAFFNVFLKGELYSMDAAIPGAAEFISRFVAAPSSGLVVYLSGRRQGTEEQSREWCRRHGFPDGIIIHRRTGMNSQRFKADFLCAIRASPLVGALVAHVGDREADDGGAARAAGIPFLHILFETEDGSPPPKPWPEFSERVWGGCSDA